jgi:hypothetical protein
MATPYDKLEQTLLGLIRLALGFIRLKAGSTATRPGWPSGSRSRRTVTDGL